MIPDPRELFRGLPKTGRVRKLRPQQDEVLSWYWPQHVGDSKVAIELPTGAGKSLLAILIGRAWLEAGKRVAILAGTKFLMEDLQKKAAEVGVETVLIAGEAGVPDEEKPDRMRNILRYRRRGVIGVFNYWSYLYGKIEKPDLLIVDDAHVFEEALFSFYTFEISREKHSYLWDRVFAYLRAKGGHYAPWLEAFGLGVFRPDAFEVIYLAHGQDIADIVRPYFRQLQVAGGPPHFDFIRNEGKLDQYLVLLSKESIVLTPHIRPIDGHERLQGIESTIYMSATLGSDEVLYKSLGSFHPISVISWDQLPTRVSGVGKRLILPVPVNDSPYGISSQCFLFLRDLAKAFEKLLVFTVTDGEAQRLQEIFATDGYDCSIYNSRAGNIEEFASKERGILITAGRYTGLDLPGETCEVGVVTRLPIAVDPIDHINRNVLEDNRFLEEKVAHRLTQAFGRLNRDEADRAVFFVLDRRFEAELTGPVFMRHVPLELAAQAEIGYLRTSGEAIKSVALAKDFLAGRYLEYEIDLDKSLKGLTSDYGGPQVRREVTRWILDEIRGWHELTHVKNYGTAYGLFKYCYEAMIGPGQADDRKKRKAAWFAYLMAVAAYLQYRFQKGGSAAKDQVRKALDQAIELGKNQWFSDLRMVVNELDELPVPAVEVSAKVLQHKEEVVRRWIGFVKRYHREPAARLEDLVQALSAGSHAKVCDSLEEIMNLLGFDVEQPPGQGTPDLVVYGWATHEPFVSPWEVKTSEEGGPTRKSDVTQAKGQQSVYEQKFEHFHVYPALFSNRQEIDPLAVEHARGAVNIIMPAAVEKLARAVFPHVLGVKGIEDTYESRVAYATRVPSQDTLLSILRPRETPVVAE